MIAGRGEAAAADTASAPSIRWAFAGLSLSMLLSSLGTSIANVALPALAQAFAASFQDVQWVVLAYLLAITTLIVGAGRLGDIAGRRRLLLAGIVLFTVASVLCGIAPTLPLLIAARAAQGLGAAIMMALTLAFVGETVPKEKTGSAMGLLGTMSAIGTALGPSLGGILIAGLGWRAIFLLNLPLGLLTLLLAWRTLPADRQTPKADRASFDLAGTLLLALTLAAYALAMTVGRGGFGPLNAALLAAAVFGAGLFVLAETASRIAPDPAGDVPRSGAEREPRHERARCGGDDGDAGGRPVLSLARARARHGHGRARRHCWPAGRGAGRRAGRPHDRPLRRAAHDRRGADRAGDRLGHAVGDAGSLGIPGYVAPLAVITAGYALFQTANNTGVMTDIPGDRRGVMSGMLNLSRNLGLVTGASVMGAVFALASGAADIATARPEAVAAGMRITFAVAGALMAGALAVAMASKTLRARAR